MESPAGGEAPSTAINGGEGFKASLEWDGDPALFEAGEDYTAIIRLIAEEGYTFGELYDDTAGISGFTVNGAEPVWVNNNGYMLTFKVTFKTTGATGGPGSPGAPTDVTATAGDGQATVATLRVQY